MHLFLPGPNYKFQEKNLLFKLLRHCQGSAIFLFLFSGSTYELATFCFKMDNTVGLGLDVPSDSLAQLTLVSTDTVCSNAPALNEMDQSGPFSLHVRTVKKYLFIQKVL